MTAADPRVVLAVAAGSLLAAAAILGMAGTPAPPAADVRPPAASPLAIVTARPGAPVDRPAMRAVLTTCREAGARDVPVLRDLALTHQDPLTAANAVAALGRLDAVCGDAALLRLVADPRPRVRQELVVALGRSKDRRALPVLHDVLAGEDREERRLALLALVELGERDGLLARVPAEDRAFAYAALQARGAPARLASR